MRKITKEPEPKFWSDFKKKNPKVKYNNLDKTKGGYELRSKIHDFMIPNQKGLCCYCCKSIDVTNSHNEHIKPQNSYPDFSMDYHNLLASCDAKMHCDHAKGSKYDESFFVSPLDDDCENQFEYLPDGRIEGISDKGKYPVNLLNLNSYDLRQARKTLFKKCLEAAKLDPKLVYEWYIHEREDGRLPRFVDMIKYFYDLGVFIEK